MATTTESRTTTSRSLPQPSDLLLVQRGGTPFRATADEVKSFMLSAATAAAIGAIKPGTNLSVDGDGTLHATSRNIEAGEVGMALHEMQRCFIGDRRRLEIEQRVEQLKLRRIFAEVGAETDLAQLMPMKPAAANENGDLSGLGDPRDDPGG